MGGLHQVLRLFGVTLHLTFILSCVSLEKDELTRALEEIDHQKYSQAIHRLEQLRARRPSVRWKEEFVDLLSSAYMGQSGIGILDTLSYWLEKHQNFQSFVQVEQKVEQMEDGSQVGILGLLEFENLVVDLIPMGLEGERRKSFAQALNLCQETLSNPGKIRLTTRRIPIKSMILNFWVALLYLRDHVLPSLHQILKAKQAIDRRFYQGVTLKALEGVFEGTENIGSAVSRLSENEKEDFRSAMDAILFFSQMITTLNWFRDHFKSPVIQSHSFERIQSRLVYY